MKPFVLWVIGCFFLLPCVCSAKTACLWINEATAYGVLGGVPDSTSNMTQITPEQCSFDFKNASISHRLVVKVEVAKDPVEMLKSNESKCGRNAVAMRAIGNEAMMCEGDIKKRTVSERVVGRVRDSVFTIDLTFSGDDAASLSKDVLEEKTRFVAEQVSGNLF